MLGCGLNLVEYPLRWPQIRDRELKSDQNMTSSLWLATCVLGEFGELVRHVACECPMFDWRWECHLSRWPQIDPNVLWRCHWWASWKWLGHWWDLKAWLSTQKDQIWSWTLFSKHHLGSFELDGSQLSRSIQSVIFPFLCFCWGKSVSRGIR